MKTAMGPVESTPLPLVAITDRTVLGMGSLLKASEAAVAAGLPALMLREKDLPEEEALSLAASLREITRGHHARLLINRRLNVARAVDADGVHLGADGPTVAQARHLLGNSILIGYSAHDINEGLRAFEDGADYVIFSPIYETPTKAGLLQPVGLEALSLMVKAAPGPVLALGGIDASRIADVAQTGVAGIAVVRAIFGAADPGEATSRLLRLWEAARPCRPDRLDR